MPAFRRLQPQRVAVDVDALRVAPLKALGAVRVQHRHDVERQRREDSAAPARHRDGGGCTRRHRRARMWRWPRLRASATRAPRRPARCRPARGGSSVPRPTRRPSPCGRDSGIARPRRRGASRARRESRSGGSGGDTCSASQVRANCWDVIRWLRAGAERTRDRRRARCRNARAHAR